MINLSFKKNTNKKRELSYKLKKKAKRRKIIYIYTNKIELKEYFIDKRSFQTQIKNKINYFNYLIS